MTCAPVDERQACEAFGVVVGGAQIQPPRILAHVRMPGGTQHTESDDRSLKAREIDPGLRVDQRRSGVRLPQRASKRGSTRGRPRQVQMPKGFTDTGSYSDIVFALITLLGFDYRPRLTDLPDAKLWRILIALGVIAAPVGSTGDAYDNAMAESFV
ncbi:MAG: Tn3 family transposase, partial [Solirubrobacteraceae bacterium]